MRAPGGSRAIATCAGLGETSRMPSEAIRYFHYDPARRELSVGFRPSGDYVYEGVPPEVYEALVATTSRGAYVNREIKPRFAFRRKERPRRP